MIQEKIMNLASMLGTLKEEVLAQGAIEIVKSFFGGMFTTAGEGVGKQLPKTVENYMTIKFGLKTEDERRYNLAKRKMELADRIRWEKKYRTLAEPNNVQLSDERYNYFRICLPLDNVDDTADILTGYAQLTDEAWDRECETMGFRFQSDGVTLQKFLDAAGVKQQQLSTSFAAHPIRERMKNYRDQSKNRADNQDW